MKPVNKKIVCVHEQALKHEHFYSSEEYRSLLLRFTKLTASVPALCLQIFPRISDETLSLQSLPCAPPAPGIYLCGYEGFKNRAHVP